VRLPRLLAGGALVALITGTAACGMQAVEPKLQLRDAAREFAAASTGALELSVASSVDEVRAFAQAADPSGGDAGMTDEDLATILSGSLEYGYDLGEDSEDTTDDAARFALHIGALDAAEFVASGNVAYARVDLDGLAEEFPEMREGLDTFRAQLTGEDGISPPAPATVLEPITALLDGEWVSMDVEAYLDQLDELSAGTEGGGPADMGLSAETAAQLRDLLGTALKDAVVSVERREADDELGDHLVAGLDLRKAYTELASGLPDLFTGAAADGLRESLPPVTDVPDKQIDVSFWVLDDELTRVELDLAQFLDEPAGHLVLRADVRPGQEITAPSGAVEFDVAALMEAGTSAYQPTEEAQQVPEVDAHMVATWVDMDFASLAYEWHTAPSVHLLPEVLPSYEGIAEGLEITAVGNRIQVTLDQETVCLTLSFYGNAEDIIDGPC
jgi:hypothetical protein